MKSIISFLEMLFKIFGINTALSSLIPKTFNVRFSDDGKQATIILGYTSITAIDKMLVSLFNSLIQTHEAVVSVSISGNNIIVLVNI